MKYGEGNAPNFRPKTQYEDINSRLIYGERRRIIFAAAMILVYLVLMLSDFRQITLSVEPR